MPLSIVDYKPYKSCSLDRKKNGSSGCGEIFSLLTTLVKGSPVSNGFLTCIVTQSFSTLSLLRNWLSLVAGQTGFYAQVVSGVVGFLVCGGTHAPLYLHQLLLPSSTVCCWLFLASCATIILVQLLGDI